MSYGYGSPGYYAPQGPTGPREHPSANTALILAVVGNFCLGAVTGVPAIIVGRRVVEAVQVDPQRWKGAGTAKFAIVLGWISVFETAFMATLMVAHGYASGIVGIVVGLLGLVLVVLSSVDSVPLRALRTSRVAIGVPFAGVLVGAAFGLFAAFGKDSAATKRCADARVAYPISIKKEDFAAARGNINDIEKNCKASDDAASMRTEIASKEADSTKRKAQEEKENQAKLAASKEKNAVETFPAKSKDISAMLKAVQSKAWAGKWEDSDVQLTLADSALDDFRGTSVEQSKDFVSLTSQIATQRKAIQPQLDAIKEKRRKDEVASAATLALRGPKPENSAWDGSIFIVERAIKANRNDPDSYEHVSTTIPTAEDDYWTCVTTFRGKNAFGGKVVNSKKVWIQSGHVVKYE